MNTLSDKSFKTNVLKAKRPVMVSFWSVWDEMSKVSRPKIEQLASKLKGKVDVFLLNSDENAKISRKCNVSTYPTTVLFDKGEIVQRFDGYHPDLEYLNV